MIYKCDHCRLAFDPEASTARDFTGYCDRACEDRADGTVRPCEDRADLDRADHLTSETSKTTIEGLESTYVD